MLCDRSPQPAGSCWWQRLSPAPAAPHLCLHIHSAPGRRHRNWLSPLFLKKKKKSIELILIRIKKKTKLITPDRVFSLLPNATAKLPRAARVTPRAVVLQCLTFSLLWTEQNFLYTSADPRYKGWPAHVCGRQEWVFSSSLM